EVVKPPPPPYSCPALPPVRVTHRHLPEETGPPPPPAGDINNFSLAAPTCLSSASGTTAQYRSNGCRGSWTGARYREAALARFTHPEEYARLDGALFQVARAPK